MIDEQVRNKAARECSGRTEQFGLTLLKLSVRFLGRDGVWAPGHDSLREGPDFRLRHQWLFHREGCDVKTWRRCTFHNSVALRNIAQTLHRHVPDIVETMHRTRHGLEYWFKGLRRARSAR